MSEGIIHHIDCLGGCERKDFYRGESSHNAYTRGLKQQNDLNAHNVNNSALWRHCRDFHGGTGVSNEGNGDFQKRRYVASNK